MNQDHEDSASPPATAPGILIAAIAAGVMLLWLPIDTPIGGLDSDGAPLLLHLFDLPLLVLVLAWLANRAVTGRCLAFSLTTVLTAALVGSVIVSILAAPSRTTGGAGARLLAAVVVAWFLSRLRHHDRRLVLTPLVIAAVLQAVIGTIQVGVGTTLGLQAFGERNGLYEISGASVPTGTLMHPYWFAGLCCLALGVVVAIGLRRPQRWTWAAGGLLILVVGLSLSRGSLLAVVSLLALTLAKSFYDPRVIPLLLALILGFGIAISVRADAWVGRVDRTLSPSYEESGSGVGGRLLLAREGLTLLRKNPWSGVGPGNYMDAAKAQLGAAFSGEPAHSVPLLAAAELGVLGGVAFLLLLGAAAFRAAMRGAAAMCVFVSFLPFALLNSFSYISAQGLLLTAIWLGSSWSWENCSAEGEAAILPPTRHLRIGRDRAHSR